MSKITGNRREFLQHTAFWSAGIWGSFPIAEALSAIGGTPSPGARLGLVTYLWGKDWDLPTLIANCEKTGFLGVELRTRHKHGVEPGLNNAERREVKKRFADSKVTLLGPGSNECFDHPDPTRLAKSIEAAKGYIKLSRDIGGTGVKVKPNSFHKGVPREKTIEQIGKSLNIVGAYAADYGQQVRLEVHGSCCELPTIKAIMDIADHPNVAVCWNCNDQDLNGGGLEYNFNLVKDRFGQTVHVRELNIGKYPYQELLNLFTAIDYQGWILLEARTNPKDPIKSLIEQRKIWERMVATGRRKAAGIGQNSKGVKITESDKTMLVEINGKLFTEYNYQAVDKPFFYPVIGPTGQNITRHWPMKDGPDEQHDHRHHQSLWFTHGDVNGHDFWAAGKSKVVHDKFLETSSSDKVGVIKSANKWVATNDKVVCTDTRTHTFHNTPDDYRIMDFEVSIHASHGKVMLGDTKEGSMAMRLAPTMRLKGKVGKGNIVNSAGDRDDKTWGKPAVWCDYYGPLNGEIVGAAIFNHPDNPRDPTWWHVRNYGLFAANPFGASYFQNKPKGAGTIEIPAGESLTFKYRLYFHKGNEKQARVARLYEEYVNSFSREQSSP